MPDGETLSFLCDEMLGRLARYLRAAGYDTALASGGAADRDLLSRAHEEDRLFLTCDRGVAEHKAARDRALILPRASLPELARGLAHQVPLEWLHAPFTRCLVDNTALLPVTNGQSSTLPCDVQREGARGCPTCNRVYWAGSHFRRMRQRLEAWARGEYA